MPNRVPSKITEIYCKDSGSTCGKNSMFQVISQKNVKDKS